MSVVTAQLDLRDEVRHRSHLSAVGAALVLIIVGSRMPGG